MHKFTGQRIKHLRQSRGMTQEELGKLLGVKKSAIQKYEADGIDLKGSKIKQLCQIFHIMPRYFIFETDEEFWNTVYGAPLQTKMKNGQIQTINRLEKDLAGGRINAEILSLISLTFKLNDKGRIKVENYISDLVLTDVYTKEEQGE